MRRLEALEFEPMNTPPLNELKPRLLMLYALGLCSAKTAVSLMDKMRVPLNDFAVEVEGVLEDDPPQVFSGYNVFMQRFILTSDPERPGDLDTGKIARAMELTHEKYCSLSLMMRRIAPITYEVVLDGKKILEGSTENTTD